MMTMGFVHLKLWNNFAMENSSLSFALSPVSAERYIATESFVSVCDAIFVARKRRSPLNEQLSLQATATELDGSRIEFGLGFQPFYGEIVVLGVRTKPISI